ncbi:MAG: HAMP domain-containing sensor histidine kinase [Flavobacteriaceae bacterium]|jgi:signal transduction histidine kinase|nr:HAMP domain-containing sensor histidine kinase [Flavobacteriaceae bacterium]
MRFSEKRHVVRGILIIASFIIVSLILWNTYTFFQIFKEDERNKMELWAVAQKTLQNSTNETEIELTFRIISNNTTIPLIQTNANDSIIGTSNLDKNISEDQKAIQTYLQKLKRENDPVVIEYDEGKFQYLYYGNSSLLNKLKYYPVALLLIIVLFGLLIYNFYQTSKIAAQNKLWAGMAKETAHQIGTPLSSLIGWLEIMKSENIDSNMVVEIEKDIVRLQTIADRFSKIGSEPVLEQKDVVEETQKSFDYLRSRFSNQIDFSFTAPEYSVDVMLNPALHSWTIENLIKNAVDAMRGRGKLTLDILADEKYVKIFISDTGKGIPKNQFKKIFDPGFTTKKRGWGLGLSLTKRIVEEYHKGKIKVEHSELGKGTTIAISFKKTSNL